MRMSTYTLYTKPQCSNCEAAKQLLQTFDQEYTEKVIGQDITREEVIEQFPGIQFAPIILIDGAQITFDSLKFVLNMERTQKNAGFSKN